jgi:hypothetical protein
VITTASVNSSIGLTDEDQAIWDRVSNNFGYRTTAFISKAQYRALMLDAGDAARMFALTDASLEARAKLSMNMQR